MKTISFVLAFGMLAILLGALPSLALVRADSGSDNSGESNDNSGPSSSSSSQPTCPSGYILSSDGTTCNLDQSQQQQQPTCPSGYSLSSDGTTCTSNQPSTPTCPSGYTLSSDQTTCENNVGNAIKQGIGNAVTGAIVKGGSHVICGLIGIPC